MNDPIQESSATKAPQPAPANDLPEDVKAAKARVKLAKAEVKIAKKNASQAKMEVKMLKKSLDGGKKVKRVKKRK